MRKLVINNLTADELNDLYCVLLHISACYVNLSHPCKGTYSRRVDGVHISATEFQSISKILKNLCDYFQHLNVNEKS